MIPPPPSIWLRETVQYELAFTLSFDYLYPAYIRGLAYLELGDGRSAAGEFQKLIDNPGLCWVYHPAQLARLQLVGTEADGRQRIRRSLTKNS